MFKFYDCGIDLGTTNSCIAVQNDTSGFEVLNNTNTNSQVTPSAVMRRMVKGEAKTYVGKIAFESSDMKNVKKFFKREMGTDTTFFFEKAKETWSPEELSAEVLKELVSHASSRLDKKLEDVVITVPAAFTIIQNEATVRAGKLAGFRSVALLQEPIAAAIAYGMKEDSDNQYWLVFDFGGGTLDTALVSTYNGRIKVVNCEGDVNLGGKDIDQRIINAIILPKMEEEGLNVDIDNPIFKRKIELEAEKCKIELSSNNESTFSACYDDDPRAFVDIDGEPIEFIYDITIEEYENAIRDIIQRTIDIAEKTIHNSSITKERLDRIVLVGGSTYIPLVRNMIASAFDVPVECELNPMTVVAAGAAIYAGSYSAQIDSMGNIETDSSEIEVKLRYERITNKSNTKIKCVISPQNNIKANEIKIDCFSTEERIKSDFSTGWISAIDSEKGLFSTSIELGNKGRNYLTITARDEKGSILSLSEKHFEIIYNENAKKLDAAPLNDDICIRVMSEEIEQDRLDVLINKNTPLPAEATKIYKTNKELDPQRNDTLTLEFYEGRIYDNPGANTLFGRVIIKANEQINKVIPEGTELKVKLVIDNNREAHFSGRFESLDLEVEAELIRDGDKRNLSDELSVIDASIENLETRIENLKYTNPQLSMTLFARLSDIKKRMISIYTIKEPDTSEVQRIIIDYHEIETEVIKEEILLSKQRKENEKVDKIRSAVRMVGKHGDEEDKAQLNEWIEKYNSSSEKEEKEYYYEKISTKNTEMSLQDFDFLSDILYKLKHPMFRFTDDIKAQYWMQKGDDCIMNKDTRGLMEAIFELFNLWDKTSGNDILPDIKI